MKSLPRFKFKHFIELINFWFEDKNDDEESSSMIWSKVGEL